MDDIQSGSVDGADAAAAAAVSRSDDHERSRIANNDDSVLTTATSEDRSASLEDSDYQERAPTNCAANASAHVQNFHGCIHTIGQKAIRQDYEVNVNV